MIEKEPELGNNAEPIKELRENEAQILAEDAGVMSEDYFADDLESLEDEGFDEISDIDEDSMNDLFDETDASIF